VTRRSLNFSAGPTALPAPVLARIQHELMDYQGTGMGVMEISHRAPVIEELLADTTERARRLLGLGDDFEVLLLQGGGSLQFSMIPLNLSAPGEQADYVDTGYWARKAIREAELLGRDTAVVASTAAGGYRHIPPAGSVQSRPGARYLHIVTNNTVEGTQFRQPPRPAAPLVADMSSDLMSGTFDPSAYHLVYAHTQKNIGIAGLTLVILRKSLLAGIPPGLPTILDYRTHSRHRSNYHTPPVFAIYVTRLMLEWLENDIGGLTAMGAINERKADALYGYLDSSPFYTCPVHPGSRSLMNVVFTLPSARLQDEFLAEAQRAGIAGLAGHRSVGGCRASLFNGVTPAAVAELVDFLQLFERRHELTGSAAV
jgi:phosphoserine aminotransferase